MRLAVALGVKGEGDAAMQRRPLLIGIALRPGIEGVRQLIMLDEQREGGVEQRTEEASSPDGALTFER